MTDAKQNDALAYRVELVYPNDEISSEKNFLTEGAALEFYNQLIKDSADDGYIYEYATIYAVNIEDADDIEDLDITDHLFTISTHTFSYPLTDDTSNSTDEADD